MSTRKCPDCLNPIKVCRELGGCGRGVQIEAHGVQGFDSKPWVKTFADGYALSAWADKNGAEVHGTRKLSEGTPVTVESIEKKQQRARIARIERRKALREERLHAELVETRYGTPQPQIKLTGGADEHFRAIHAELLQLAAAVELATIPTREAWLVRVEMDSDFAGRVTLELADDAQTEVDRGMALLTKIVRDAHLAQAKAVRS